MAVARSILRDGVAYLSVDAVGHTLVFEMSRERPRKIPVIRSGRRVQLGGLHGPAFPQTPTEAGPCSVLLTLSEPAASLSLAS
jgi:hypothetical protein